MIKIYGKNGEKGLFSPSQRRDFLSYPPILNNDLCFAFGVFLCFAPRPYGPRHKSQKSAQNQRKSHLLRVGG